MSKIAKVTSLFYNKKDELLVENLEELKGLDVSNIEALTDEELDNLKVGDCVRKVTGNMRHNYIVTYKEEKHGICLSYYACGYLETISYDYVGGHWVFNSKDVWTSESDSALPLYEIISTTDMDTFFANKRAPFCLDTTTDLVIVVDNDYNSRDIKCLWISNDGACYSGDISWSEGDTWNDISDETIQLATTTYVDTAISQVRLVKTIEVEADANGDFHLPDNFVGDSVRIVIGNDTYLYSAYWDSSQNIPSFNFYKLGTPTPIYMNSLSFNGLDPTSHAVIGWGSFAQGTKATFTYSPIVGLNIEV